MSRRSRHTLTGDIHTLYPNRPTHHGNVTIETDVQIAFPFPARTFKSVVCDLVAAVLIKYGSMSNRHLADNVVGKYGDTFVGSILVYGRNDGYGGRTPKAMSEQFDAFRRDVYAAIPYATKYVKTLEGKPADIPAEVPTPKPEVKVTSDPMESYLQWSREVRAMCARRNADGHALDQWSMRPTLDGLKLIKSGVPIEAVKDSVTMHFPDDARREIGVQDFDFVKHGIADYLLTASAARIPLMLIGPKGTGKTTHAQLLADTLEFDFGMVSMTAGTSPSAFYGRPKVGGDGGVVESRFCKLYRDGGVYLFDEMDAADPNILLIVNSALSNGHFDNPATGEQVERSADFIPLAAANTMGLGGGRDYTGRDRLDAATLDRWSAGRIRVDLDTDLETKLALEIIGA